MDLEPPVDRPLSGLVVVDATSELGWYPGKVFSDLGAEIVVLESEDADAEDCPIVWPVGGRSARDVFAGVAGRRRCGDRDAALAAADILLTSEGPRRLRERGLHPDDLAAFPRLIHVAMSPFGLDGPYADRPASDLTLLAAGGLLRLAGEPGRAPVRVAGEQTAVMVGLHAAVGALIAVLAREETGRGQIVDASAQQAVAHSLENAIQYLDLEGVVRGRTAGTATEVGNGLFRCADGWVYLVAGIGGAPLAWDGLVAWLEADGLPAARVTELREDRWTDPAWRRTHAAAHAFREVFESFAANRPKLQLYERAQAHGVSLAPVATPQDLLASPQLAARAFFRTVEIDGQPVVVPGPPYRFEEPVAALPGAAPS
jgi:benzylsuccinate CoA-transferase BbsE subunit